MRLAHTRDLAALRPPSRETPWRVLVSGCMAGWACGVDGTDYGFGAHFADLFALPTLQVVPFCPEQHGLGTPRTWPDLDGGDGFDVLDGRARVVDDHGADLTAGMVAGAEAMAAHARAHAVDWALLMDMSAACGSQVISDGSRFRQPRRYRAGVGVATAALIRAGVPVISQRDDRTLGALRAWADPGFVVPDDAVDHHERTWYIEQFGPRG